MTMLSLSVSVRSDHCETHVDAELEFQEMVVDTKLAENHSALECVERLLVLQDK